jgi:hypothetical protein
VFKPKAGWWGGYVAAGDYLAFTMPDGSKASACRVLAVLRGLDIEFDMYEGFAFYEMESYTTLALNGRSFEITVHDTHFDLDIKGSFSSETEASGSYTLSGYATSYWKQAGGYPSRAPHVSGTGTWAASADWYIPDFHQLDPPRGFTDHWASWYWDLFRIGQLSRPVW